MLCCSSLYVLSKKLHESYNAYFTSDLNLKLLNIPYFKINTFRGLGLLLDVLSGSLVYRYLYNIYSTFLFFMFLEKTFQSAPRFFLAAIVIESCNNLQDVLDVYGCFGAAPAS